MKHNDTERTASANASRSSAHNPASAFCRVSAWTCLAAAFAAVAAADDGEDETEDDSDERSKKPDLRGAPKRVPASRPPVAEVGEFAPRIEKLDTSCAGASLSRAL